MDVEFEQAAIAKHPATIAIEKAQRLYNTSIPSAFGVSILARSGLAALHRD
ncbi:MAG TPA: hypothetical protein VGZ02_17365 [Candidatus Baltobacteraceae bacterium]|nr:hypothetical protein [Candidatus Baltobacteraceae bacterium]